jgi:hypothetical protein
MPLFGRRATPELQWFTVGVQGHRVAPGAHEGGIAQLEGLGDYVEAISKRRPPGPDGRDTIAVLNAKMDHADSVNDLVAAAALACEELVERGLLDPALQPPSPPYPGMRRDLSTYDYIQQLHARAVDRRAWLQVVDALLREHHVALLAPLPVEE